MTVWLEALGIATGGAAIAGALGYAGLRRKGLDRWLIPYLLSKGSKQKLIPGEPIDLFLAVCDHYEPQRAGASHEKAKARVQQWIDEYPKLFDRFRDSEGKPPQHSFFYPADEYHPELVDMIGGLCRSGYGEVEIHLHHDNDTADHLRNTLLDFKTTLHERHGLLSKDRETGEVVYGFIHGNWCLNNSRRDGRHCGVNNELDILRETGCYADFTLPSSPSETQTRKVNSIYWAVDDPHRPKSHNTGIDLGTAPKPPNSLLMIQGPLVIDWKQRKFGIIPKVENSCLQKNQPPDKNRIECWLNAGVSVATKPNWLFAKLHTHGVNEPNQDVLLGQPMVRFHETLQERTDRNPLFRFHYVTAREMANIALAAESGVDIPINTARSLRYSPIG